jgi:sensor histidine kinase YesM
MYKLLVGQNAFHKVLRHLFLFLAMVLLFTWVASTRSEEHNSFLKELAMVSTNALFFFGYAYLTVYLLIPRFMLRRRVILFVLLFMAIGLGLSLLKFVFSDYIFFQAIAPESTPPGRMLSLSDLLINTKDMTFIVAIFALVRFARDHYILESNILELQKKSLEAELKLIEHQMDPHVIFNNFNNLYSISIYRPEYLESTVKKLKSLLHYLFTDSKSSEVLLSREVEMIRNYMGMEKLRYGERLDSTFQVDGKLDGLSISPLILYSFVENCYVHGAGEDPENSWIRIEVKVKDSRLIFRAANSVSDQHGIRGSNEQRGINENSVSRLELQYPNSHRLTIREKRNEHIVELNLIL